VAIHAAGLLASGSRDGRIVLRTLRGNDVRRVVRVRHPVTALEFIDGGRLLLAAGRRGGIDTIEVATGRFGRPFRTPWWYQKRVHTVAASPDGDVVAGAGDHHRVHVWRFRDRRLVRRTRHGRVRRVRYLSAVAFSPDGSTLATAGNDRKVQFRDTDTWRSRAVRKDHRAAVTGIAFLADDRLLSGGNDRALHVVTPGVGTTKIRAHGKPVTAVASCVAQGIAVTADDGGTIKVWSIADLTSLPT
jgi:WD40 repeat protein